MNKGLQFSKLLDFNYDRPMWPIMDTGDDFLQTFLDDLVAHNDDLSRERLETDHETGFSSQTKSTEEEFYISMRPWTVSRNPSIAPQQSSVPVEEIQPYLEWEAGCHSTNNWIQVDNVRSTCKLSHQR